GGLIGLERSFHGRPAGFRTHALVCLASSLLMLVTLYQGHWAIAELPADSIRTDPTRMAQGIMTGIGFLGAGVIFKEGLSVRGLTTAASIWLTAAIGILIGIGFYFPAAVACLAALGTLSGFRVIERKMPSEFYAHHWVKFLREDAVPADIFRAMVEQHGFSIANFSYRLTDEGKCLEYRMVIKTSRRDNADRLANALQGMAAAREYRIAPTGD
ncbi:MAG: MgtC/SapB family protein, partial [Rhodospirillales bacterium]|nr:MgtC/SapB family protein [Rhodospirillales bacterium]